MMRLIENGEPVFHRHQCSSEREGSIMTAEELHAFAVDILCDEYSRSGSVVKRLCGINKNDADLLIESCGRTVCIKVLYQHEFGQYENTFDSALMSSRFLTHGEIPRLVLASAWCDASPVTGSPAVCGASFCFKFYPISLLPGEYNETLPAVLPVARLAALYAEAWNRFDASVIEPYLDKDFHYSSDFVFDELPSRYEYLHYFKSKLTAIASAGIALHAVPAVNPGTSEAAVLLRQKETAGILLLKAENGFLLSARMAEYEEKNSDD